MARIADYDQAVPERASSFTVRVLSHVNEISGMLSSVQRTMARIRSHAHGPSIEEVARPRDEGKNSVPRGAFSEIEASLDMLRDQAAKIIDVAEALERDI